MKDYTYTVIINQPKEVVYNTLINKEIYSQWAKAWGPNMTFTGSWEQGSHISFHDDKSGTKAFVEEHLPSEKIVLTHVAMVDSNNHELTESDEAMEKWKGTKEAYYFEENNDNQTTLTVKMHMDPLFEDMSNGAWPKALQNLKEICEDLS